MLIVWWLWACEPAREPSAASVAAGQTLVAWSEGRSAEQRGDLTAARAGYERALATRERDPLLLAWLAQVEAADGRVREAVELLDRALVSKPSFSVARYNRAAYKARLGELSGAGEDLALALRGGASTPRRAMQDPDFRPHLADPAFAFLPASPITVRWTVPSELAFVGSKVELSARVDGVEPDQLAFDLPVRGPVQVVREQQDLTVDEAGDPALSVSWTLLVGGAGEVRVGPMRVEGAGVVHVEPARSFVAGAPAGHQGTPELGLALLLPSSRLAGRPTPVVWREGEATWAAVGGEERVEVAPRAQPTLAGVITRDGVVVARYARYDAPLQRVALGAGGAVLWTAESPAR